MASKIAISKTSMGYMPKSNRICGHCANFESERKPIPWMAQHNQRLEEDHKNGRNGWEKPFDLTLPANQTEGAKRCGLGGFAVQKTGFCTMWVRKA